MLCSIWNVPDGFATLVAGIFVVIAAIIAWQGVQRQIRAAHADVQRQISSVQKIERTKLRLDLYNRRFTIFVSIFDFWKALSDWKDTPEQRAAQTEFFRAYQESGFLFSKESGIQATLEKLYRDSGKVIGFKEHGHDYMEGGVEFYLEQHRQMNEVLIHDFDAALVTLRAAMGKYLNFHTIVEDESD